MHQFPSTVERTNRSIFLRAKVDLASMPNFFYQSMFPEPWALIVTQVAEISASKPRNLVQVPLGFRLFYLLLKNICQKILCCLWATKKYSILEFWIEADILLCKGIFSNRMWIRSKYFLLDGLKFAELAGRQISTNAGWIWSKPLSIVL